MRVLMRPIAAALLIAAGLLFVPTANAQVQSPSPGLSNQSPNIPDQKLDAAAAAIERVASLKQDYQQRIATAALESPGVNRVADRVVNGPSVERLVAEVIESRLMDETVARLLESEDLWILVDEIARSPSVTDAIGHQGLGFAEQLAAVVRERSRRGDARLEHVARRWARRDGGDSGSES